MSNNWRSWVNEMFAVQETTIVLLVGTERLLPRGSDSVVDLYGMLAYLTEVS